jgi:hypothetical protein
MGGCGFIVGVKNGSKFLKGKVGEELMQNKSIYFY